MHKIRAVFVLFLILLGIGSLCALHAQMVDKPTRLILKDGSYQPATKYEIKGDRVRYLSAERYDWEEIPKTLIDWDATQKYAEAKEKEAAAGLSPEGRAANAEEEAERQAELDKTPLVSPGIRLPSSGGVYLLDVFSDRAELVELVQNGGEINKNMGRNILRATINPFAGSKQSIELKGQHSRVQSHVPNPFVYVNIDDDQAANGASSGSSPIPAKDRFRIVRAQVKKDSRVAGNIKVAVYGKVHQEETFVPVTIEVMKGGWVKVIPSEPLQPGEYALVEMLGDQKLNLYVWDFGVNPSAPDNPGTWKSEPEKAETMPNNQRPVLNTHQP
jgi:hypothetical protein